MSIVYENYLIIVLSLLTSFLGIKYLLTIKLMSKERKYFIETLSHDIRVSVIAQIRGLELLYKTLSSAQTDLFKELNCNSRYTLDMISMLINTYKYKNNDLLLKFEPLHISEILFDVTESIEQQLREKELRFDCCRGIKTIIADKTWITKALQIIISTMIDLSDTKKTITCSISDFGNNIKLDFTYTGKSITQKEYRKMFAGNTKYSTVGLGIKMLLLQNIINLHSGKIAVQNKKSGENTFTILIPAKKSVICHKYKLLKAFS